MTYDAYSYDFDAMAVAHEDISGATQEFNRIQDTIQRSLDRLRTAWPEGAAASTVRAYSAEWLAIFADVVSELHRLGVAVDLSRRNAQVVEAANCAMWNA